MGTREPYKMSQRQNGHHRVIMNIIKLKKTLQNLSDHHRVEMDTKEPKMDTIELKWTPQSQNGHKRPK